MTFTPDLTNDIYKCCSCGLVSAKVECSGIYYCPNKLCTVSGSTCHKKELKSYIDYGVGSIRIDPIEIVEWGFELLRIETDPNMIAAMNRSLDYWMNLRPQYWVENVIDS